MEVVIDTKEMVQIARRLARYQPLVFDKATSKSLIWAASTIALKSAVKAGQVARFEGNYAGGFRHSRVMGTPSFRWIKAYNIHGYSMVIEHGATRWKVPPPVDALAHWGQSKLGLGEKEALAFSLAFGLALTGKGNSKTAQNARAGRARKALKVMTNATLGSIFAIKNQFKKNYKNAFKILKAHGKKV